MNKVYGEKCGQKLQNLTIHNLWTCN